MTQLPEQPVPADDPINASGEYFFKRFSQEPDQAAVPPSDDAALDDVVTALSQTGEPPSPRPAALTITFQTWATPVVGILMLLFGLAGGYFLRPVIDPVADPGGASSTNPTGTNTQAQSSPEERAALMDALLPNVRHFRGDPDAPIAVIEFSDFQCPFCGQWAGNTGKQINEEYVESGEVRIGYVHFAFLGPESQWAAEASECAAEQDMFWEFHDHLFANQNGENRGAFNKDILKGFAAQLGLNTTAFNACMDAERYAATVQNETAWAQSVGVQSTPTFVVNGFPVIGAQTIDVFEEVFNTVLTP